MDHRLPNDDVVTEILLNLPVKSLLRFKNVSKSWCGIIDSSAFAKLHAQNQYNNKHNNDDAVVLHFNCGKKYMWELSMMFPDHGKSYKDSSAIQEFFNNNKFWGIRFSGPFNGLICIHENYLSDKDGPPSPWNRPIAVCNPCLGKIKILPKSPICSSFQNSNKDSRLVIVSHNTGFGFDDVTKDYKIVQLLSCDGHRIYVEIYSRTTNTWRELVTETLDQSLLIKKPIKSSHKNGSFAHWRARTRDVIGIHDNILLSFDMRNEVFQTVWIPEFEDRDRKCKIFAKDDSFVLFVYPRHDDYFGRGNKWLTLWELRSVGNRGRWTILWQFGPGLGIPRPKALWKSNGVVLRYNSSKKRKLIFYDYFTRKIRRCLEMPEDGYWFRIFEYKGSLISP